MSEVELVCEPCQQGDHGECRDFIFLPYKPDRRQMVPFVCRCDCATMEAKKQRFFAEAKP